MKLPSLLLDANVRAALRLPAHVRETTDATVEFDGSGVIAIEPVGTCLLASAARAAEESGKTLEIKHWSPRLRSLLQDMGCKAKWLDRQEFSSASAVPVAPTLAMAIPSRERANVVANELSDRIAQFIPEEDRAEMLEDHRGLRIYHSIQPALAYVLAELIDNVFSHAQTKAHPNPMAWAAAQWYLSGDLIRVAVVDDGCGMLASLHDHRPKDHLDAMALAFRPFLTSKGLRGLYADRSHMGLGLTICRDLCVKLEGCLYAVSGNAFIKDPGLPKEQAQKLDVSHQGTIVSLEFHRRAVTTGTMQEVFARYRKPPQLRPRFES